MDMEEAVEESELVPYLLAGNLEERIRNNLMLAEIYYRKKKYQQAGVFIRRAWAFSNYEESVLKLLIDIHLRLGNIEVIREAFKNLGFKYADAGKFDKAVSFFNKWQYAYAVYEKKDKYSYDYSILNKIKSFAPHLSRKEKKTLFFSGKKKTGQKIRLAYLVFGTSHVNSVLIKILSSFAEYHDKNQFGICFFIPEDKKSLDRMPHAKKNIEALSKSGFPLCFGTDNKNEYRSNSILAQEIVAFEADALITTAGLADFWHYFILSMRPAKKIIGLVQGPPAQYASPDMDCCISWSKHPLIDTPVDAHLLSIGVYFPEMHNIYPSTKTDFGIPESAAVLFTAGRFPKYQNKIYWEEIIKILDANENAYFVVAGVSEDNLDFYDDLFVHNDHLKSRIKLLGWREDIYSLYSLADVFIVSFP
jgi:predicted O-linked N-acetylglucosamine transferase (SPINDLY family)